MADRRVKDEAKRASSLKREADSPDKSYVFEFLDSLDLTNPIDSLHETEKHWTASCHRKTNKSWGECFKLLLAS